MEKIKFYGSISNEIDSLIQTVNVMVEATLLKFVIEKPVVLILTRGKENKCEGIEISDNEVLG